MRTVSVEVDVDEVLSKIKDEDLIKEIEARKLEWSGPSNWHQMADDLRDAFVSRDMTHFDILLLRMQDLAGVVRGFSLGTKYRGERASRVARILS